MDRCVLDKEIEIGPNAQLGRGDDPLELGVLRDGDTVAPRARRGLPAQSGRHGEHPGPNRRRLQSELAGQVQARGLA